MTIIAYKSEIHHKLRRIEPGFSRFLDAARWISAVLVVVCHLNNRMMIPLSSIPADERGFFNYIWGFLSGFGHTAVVIFFILSGFLVGGKLINQIFSGEGIRLRKYAIDRVSRIYIVLIPIMLLVWILDTVGARIFATTGIYTRYNLAEHYSVNSFFGTWANLQTIFTPTWGTNGPLGTLAMEFWYYVTFPLLLGPWMKNRSLFIRITFLVMGLFLIAIWTIRLPEYGICFLVWIAGAAASMIRRPLIRNRHAALAIFLISVAIARIAIRGDTFEESILISLAVEFMTVLLFINCMVSYKFGPVAPGRILSLPVHKELADFSYSLYALHASLLTFICAIFYHYIGFGWQQQAIHIWQWSIVAIAFITTIFISKLFAITTEAHTHKVRRWLYGVNGIQK